MRNRIICTVLLVHFMFAVFSQEAVFSNYTVKDIAENLKKDANAVYRLDEAILDIASASKYTLKVHQIITILNEEGAKNLQQSIRMDKFNKVDDIEIKLYNHFGFEIQKYKKKNFAVQNYYDGFSLATDDRVMHLSISAPEFPCTIDVNYLQNVSSYVDLPNRYVDNAESSVEQFRYIVKVPSVLDIRYRTLNMTLNPVVENIGMQKVYTWETKNVSVNKIEAGGYEGYKYLPQVVVSPTVFEYDGYKGDFKSWSDFGKWAYALYEDKNAFTEQRSAEIKAFVSGLPDVDSKVIVLYKYLQKNMRYVSIQFGIGGFKPFAARFVDEKKYGDCKALVNYMRSLLSAAGIKSYPALINAGYNSMPATPEFPEDVFNHVILCIPQAKDSIWLECTSTNCDPGFLGNFTENKNALLLTERGGFMVPTPKSDYNRSVLETVNNIYINEEGGAEVKTQLHATGNFYDLLHAVNSMDGQKQNEIFVKYLDYKEPDEFIPDAENAFSEKHIFKLTSVYAKLFDFKAGDKYFFPLSISKLCDEKMILANNRKTEYIFQFPYKKTDTTIFHLPGAFKTDNLPKDEELSDGQIVYKREVKSDLSANTIKITSTLLIKSCIISPDQYKSTCLVMNKIEKEETNKLVLKK